MLQIVQLNDLRERMKSSSLVVIATLFALSGLMPIILQGQASAATLATRKVTLTTSQASATGVSYRFDFTYPSTAVSQAIRFQFCEDPLGACVKPTGMNVHHDTAATNATQTFSQTPVFTEVTASTGDCSYGTTGTAGTNTDYCVSRTGGSSTTAETAVAKQITLDTVTNPSVTTTDNLYVRITVYSDSSFTTGNKVHEGTVAAQIVNQLNVTGRVQERLSFCVFALEDAAGSNATVGTGAGEFPNNCSATEATASSSVDIGVIDNLSIARSPVDAATFLGNDRFGAAMINTNASNGVALTYYSSTAASGTEELRAFRVPGAVCTAGGTSLTDQCFISADDSAGETFAAGTERFGVQIVCVTNSDSTTAGTTKNLGTAGNGSGASGTFNTVYANGDTTQAQITDTAATDDCENTEAGNLYGWRDPAGAIDFNTAQALISSNTVVDDEVVKLRFAATANATTPTGTYTVASTYIATPTF